MRKALLLTLSLALAACGGGDDSHEQDLPGAGGTGGAGGDDVTEPSVDLGPIDWEACPWGPGECTAIDVPVDWEEPEGETLPFFVRRIPAEGESKGQLWLLQGGPGSAGWGLVQAHPHFAAMLPGYDIYVPDYRGVGYSSWLGCEGQDGGKTTTPCAARILERWGDDLAHFDTSSAARDIGHTIAALRRPEDRIYVYGTSYGTFMGNRYVQLFPEQADGVVLDSVCPASGCDVRMDRNFQKVAEHVFDLCGQDPTCSQKLGDDPWARVKALLASFEAGHCSEFYGYPYNEMLLSQLLSYSVTQAEMAPVATAAVYRAERCNVEDVSALEKLVEAFGGGGRGGFTSVADLEGDGESLYLSQHVIFSEFWPADLDLARAEREHAELTLSTGALLGRAQEKDRWFWPLYETPDELMTWSDTETPLLLLNGDLDGQTHEDGLAGVEESFRNELQHYVHVPMAGHGVVFASVPAIGDRRSTCGMQVVSSFFADPANPDTRCAEQQLSLNFDGSPWLAENLFGTDDIWENGVGTTGHAMRAPLRPEEQRALDEVRRLLQKGPGF